MLDIKIKIYWIKTFEIDPLIIWNANDLNFSEDLNSWQGGFDIDLMVDFTNTDYKVWDLFEYSIYDENYKNWLLKYSWVITKIKRNYHDNEQWITLECESITNLLVKREVDKTYSWTYKSIVDDIIADLDSNNCNMDFVWINYFKNLIQDDSLAPNLEINWNLLQALQKLFKNKTFFINQFWEIKDTFTKKHLLKFWRDIFSNDTEEDETWIINADLEIKSIQDINAWDLIKIVNTDTFLNLDWEQITKLDFTLNKKNILIWEIKQLKTN